MRVGSIVHDSNLVAVLEQHSNHGDATIWRYVIRREDTGEEVGDDWAADLDEATETVERRPAHLAGKAAETALAELDNTERRSAALHQAFSWSAGRLETVSSRWSTGQPLR